MKLQIVDSGHAPNHDAVYAFFREEGGDNRNVVSVWVNGREAKLHSRDGIDALIRKRVAAAKRALELPNRPVSDLSTMVPPSVE